MEDLLEEFIDWARENSPHAWYIFEETEEAIKAFMKYREEKEK